MPRVNAKAGNVPTATWYAVYIVDGYGGLQDNAYIYYADDAGMYVTSKFVAPALVPDPAKIETYIEKFHPHTTYEIHTLSNI